MPRSCGPQLRRIIFSILDGVRVIDDNLVQSAVVIDAEGDIGRSAVHDILERALVSPDETIVVQEVWDALMVWSVADTCRAGHLQGRP